MVLTPSSLWGTLTQAAPSLSPFMGKRCIPALLPAAAGPVLQLGGLHCRGSAPKHQCWPGPALTGRKGGPLVPCLSITVATTSLPLPLHFRLTDTPTVNRFSPPNTTVLKVNLRCPRIILGPSKTRVTIPFALLRMRGHDSSVCQDNRHKLGLRQTRHLFTLSKNSPSKVYGLEPFLWGSKLLMG